MNSVIGRDIAELVDDDIDWDGLAGATVLVTGAGGMLPAYVVRTLLALNDARGLRITVLGMVRDVRKARRTLSDVVDRPDVTLIEQDVTTPVTWDGPVDVVVHGASPARPSLHHSDPVGTLRANAIGTLNLLDLCLDKATSTFVLMSSAEVYGDHPDDVAPIGEDDYGPLNTLTPRSCYPEGKRMAETACAAYAAQYDIGYRIIRFGHVFGPGMGVNDGRVQADFARDVVNGHDIMLNSAGNAVRTYTYVADAVSGLFYALLKGTELVYNVADPGGQVSIRELATRFAHARPDRHLKVGYRAPEDERAYSPVRRQGLSSARLAALGWRARVGLEAGIDRWISSLEEAAHEVPHTPDDGSGSVPHSPVR